MSNDQKPPTGVSLRQFMGTAAAAAGITIVPRHVLGAGFQPPSDTVNVAVVGYAHGMGSNNLKNAMKSDNIVDLMAQRDIDGALVGGASLDADEFARIAQYRLR